MNDLEAKLAAVQADGGRSVERPIEVGNGARICLFGEPSGVTLAMLERRQPGEQA